MTLAIQKINSKESFKDKEGLLWPVKLKYLWHNDEVRANQSSIYELDNIQHGITCKCCSKILRKSTTHPFRYEVVKRNHKPGRPAARTKWRGF